MNRQILGCNEKKDFKLVINLTDFRLRIAEGFLVGNKHNDFGLVINKRVLGW